MQFSSFDFSDLIFLGLFVILGSAVAVAQRSFGPANRDRLARVEEKLDLLLTHAGLEYTPAPKAAWQAIADKGPAHKIAAVKAYRDATGAELADAKRAIEEYIEGRR